MRQSVFAGIALSLLAAAAQAGGTYLEVQCATSDRDGNFTHCQPPAAYSFTSDGPEARYAIKLTTPPTHCALTAYNLATDPSFGIGTGVGGGTSFMDHSKTEMVDIGSGWPAGPVTLYIFASSKVGGCNVGTMHSWGVTAEATRIGG